MKRNLSLVNDNSSIERQLKILIETVPTNAYIHIPFCRRRCYYCDFPISVVGDRPSNHASTSIADYLEALTTEIQLTASEKQPLNTIFLVVVPLNSIGKTVSSNY